MNDILLVQDLVSHKEQQFFVITINRASSALGGYGSRYAKTLVWELKDGVLNRIVGQDEAGKDSLSGHKRMCKQFKRYGGMECLTTQHPMTLWQLVVCGER